MMEITRLPMMSGRHQLQLRRRPNACFGIGDADADGACADVDCDDNDPSIAYQPWRRL